MPAVNLIIKPTNTARSIHLLYSLVNSGNTRSFFMNWGRHRPLLEKTKKYTWIGRLVRTKEKDTNVEYSNGYTEGSNQRIGDQVGKKSKIEQEKQKHTHRHI